MKNLDSPEDGSGNFIRNFISYFKLRGLMFQKTCLLNPAVTVWNSARIQRWPFSSWSYAFCGV